MNPREISNWWLPDHARIVPFAKTLGLDTVAADGTLLATLDPALAAREAAGLGPLARLVLMMLGSGGRGSAGIGAGPGLGGCSGEIIGGRRMGRPLASKISVSSCGSTRLIVHHNQSSEVEPAQRIPVGKRRGGVVGRWWDGVAGVGEMEASGWPRGDEG
jgi:hypothetical protein